MLRAAAARLLPSGRAPAVAAAATVRRAAAPLPLLSRPRSTAAGLSLPSLYLSRRSCIVAALSTGTTDAAQPEAPLEAPAAEAARSAPAFDLPEQAAIGTSEEDRDIYRQFKEGASQAVSEALAHVFPPLPDGAPSPKYVVARCVAVFGERGANGKLQLGWSHLGAS